MKVRYMKILAVLLPTLFWVPSSHGLDFESLTNAAEEKSHETTSDFSGLLLGGFVGDSEQMFGIFEEGISQKRVYRCQDGKELTLSFAYDPREKNNDLMPRITMVEEEYGNIIIHFMEQFSQTIAPKIPTYIETSLTSVEAKHEFINAHGSEYWLRKVLKIPGFSPQELFDQHLKEIDERSTWKKNLYDLLNKSQANPFSLKYSVPAHPAFLKKYQGSEWGPIEFNSKSTASSHTKGKGRDCNKSYTKDLNYGVLTVSVKMNEPEEVYNGHPIPQNLNLLMIDFYRFMKDVLKTNISYALNSYGNQRDNSGHMIH